MLVYACLVLTSVVEVRSKRCFHDCFHAQTWVSKLPGQFRQATVNPSHYCVPLLHCIHEQCKYSWSWRRRHLERNSLSVSANQRSIRFFQTVPAVAKDILAGALEEDSNDGKAEAPTVGRLQELQGLLNQFDDGDTDGTPSPKQLELKLPEDRSKSLPAVEANVDAKVDAKAEAHEESKPPMVRLPSQQFQLAQMQKALQLVPLPLQLIAATPTFLFSICCAWNGADSNHAGAGFYVRFEARLGGVPTVQPWARHPQGRR